MSQLYPNQVFSRRQLENFIKGFEGTQRPTRIKFLFKLPVYSNVAEIGVAEGKFSECILKINRPKNLHLVDPWEHQEEARFSKDPSNVNQNEQNKRFKAVRKKFAEYSGVRIHRGYSLDVVKSFPEHYFDWIYLDANHSYEVVKADLEAWYPKVKKNGIIAGHDYTQKPYFPMGVIQAVDEFIKENNLEMFLIDNDPWHSWAIRRKAKRDTFKSQANYLVTQLKRRAAKSQNYEKAAALSVVLRNKIMLQFKKS